MVLNFSNEEYKNKALSTKETKISKHSIEDAFFLLIKGVDKEDLSNLCEEMKESMQKTFEKRYGTKDLSLDDYYEILQGTSSKIQNLDNDLKSAIVALTYKCIESGKTLGNKTILDGKINTSSWMSHVLYEGKLAGELAEMLGLDKKTAVIQGILHDYGRKATHNFAHVIKGYEMLVDEGWEDEAIASLTHSFLNGGRCASNETAEEGFFVDENGNPSWEENSYKDDVTLFLENYQYSKYDTVLNIADLMATSDGIVSPYERIQDIATRRTLDPKNRGYFLADFTNTLVEFMNDVGANVPEDINGIIKATPDVSIEQIDVRFKKVSDLFFEYYNSRVANRSKRVVTEEKSLTEI